jgi:hypothetical protein
VFWSIVSLEDGIPNGVLDTFQYLKKMILKKIEMDTLVD